MIVKGLRLTLEVLFRLKKREQNARCRRALGRTKTPQHGPSNVILPKFERETATMCRGK